MTVVEAARQIKGDLCRRAAKLWAVPVEQVEFEGGSVKPIGDAAKAKPTGAQRAAVPQAWIAE
jgi:xanthine dehydrogenase molybdopterin-binding subunit B